MGFLAQPQGLFSIGPARNFGGQDGKIFLSGYVTNQESSTDSLEITQQPVQQGASIADHAFLKPTVLSIQVLFASTPNSLFSFTPVSLSKIYGQILALQSSLTLVDVNTPKRSYNNMLISAIGQTTDKKTENCLSLSISFQEVLLVSVSTTLVPKAQLKSPKKNLGTQPVGKNSGLLTTAQTVDPSIKGFQGPPHL